MTSTLSWIDYDADERDRVNRVLQLFRERETRDELGLGGIRDAFADSLFPGTSTIQTRLRYFLLIPWAYVDLEHRHVSADRFDSEARKIEMATLDALLESDDTVGVIGKEAGRALKRLPSSVYWAGLKTWGLRRFQHSQNDYHRTINSVYQRRRMVRKRDDDEIITDPRTITWHPELPPHPTDFPDVLDLQLTRGEAEFLRDQIAKNCKGSLLAALCERADRPIPDVKAPWEHPDLATFSADHRKLLEQARLFSAATNGASILYNVLLAKASKRDELIKQHTETFSVWVSDLDMANLQPWRLDDLWTAVLDRGHSVTKSTQRFVTKWMTELRSGPDALLENENACGLIREREQKLKGARSRFKNQRALDQWGGSSGIAPLNFRWTIAKQHLNDLHAGLGAP